MNKITQQAKETLRLIARSHDLGDGWRAVSVPLRKHIPTWLTSAERLYEFDGERIRFTDEGLIVMRYL